MGGSWLFPSSGKKLIYVTRREFQEFFETFSIYGFGSEGEKLSAKELLWQEEKSRNKGLKKVRNMFAYIQSDGTHAMPLSHTHFFLSLCLPLPLFLSPCITLTTLSLFSSLPMLFVCLSLCLSIFLWIFSGFSVCLL